MAVGTGWPIQALAGATSPVVPTIDDLLAGGAQNTLDGHGGYTNNSLPVGDISTNDLDLLVTSTGSAKLVDYGWRVEIFKDKDGRLYYGYRQGSGKARKYQYGGTFAKLTHDDQTRAGAYQKNSERRATARGIRAVGARPGAAP